MRGCLIALLVLFMVPVSFCAMVTKDGTFTFLMIAGAVAIAALIMGRKSNRDRPDYTRPEDLDG